MADTPKHQPDAEMSEEDPLLSATGVARLYGTGIKIVTDLVAEGKLPVLDDGSLVASGKLDVPLIRASWARALQRPSDGADRIIPPPAEAELHPAVESAVAFHQALQAGDAATAYERSTMASRRERSPGELLYRWQAHLDGPPEDSGIGSIAYSLSPLHAVAARVIGQAPLLPRMVDRPTPASLIAVLPMVEEKGAWRVDLALFEDSEDLAGLLAQPLPEESVSPSDNDAEI